MQASPLLRMTLIAALLLPPMLGLWWVLLPDVLAPPVRWIADWSTKLFFSVDVIGVRGSGTSWIALTSLSVQDKPWELVTFDIDAARFTIGWPLFWALAIATPQSRRVRHLLVGSLMLVPIFVTAILIFIQVSLVTQVNAGAAASVRDYILSSPFPDWVHAVSVHADLWVQLVFVQLAPIFVWAAVNHRLLLPPPGGGTRRNATTDAALRART